MNGKGTMNAQMQGGQNGAPEGEEFPHILMAEGESRYDGLTRI